MDFSLVITVFNEEDNIHPLLQQIDSALSGYIYEIILVDDGSTDSTIKRIEELKNPRVKLIVFTRNFGQTAAMAAGMQAAVSDYIVTMDGDLQNDPSDIPHMLRKLEEEEWDMVAGVRKNRQDGALLRKFPSKIANKLIRNLTGINLQDYGCTLKVFRASIAKNLGLYGELHRFIPILAVLEGGMITEVDVKHHPRLYGQSKYGLGRTIKVMSDLILMAFFKKYFKRPIHFFGPLGLLCFAGGFLISFYLLIVKLLGQDIWGRPLLLLGITLILAGIQFLTFGIIAELMMRVYYESQQKKPYSIKKVVTFLQPVLDPSLADGKHPLHTPKAPMLELK
ncbi:glycosyltransferase family 2 protein [Aquiflexum gelatinilyticum]|uniref:glycosyltransferase family 2 protein n=1 Tax=Aquiflexum gelatinilyticum TaxID=2961943 RepID=UPI002168F71D|nr:glycosyltransferase family 2 protein [Aquiflexum gelatinilyticum]MCS4436649.1 glycosyltransferase family 2 protein [Aquiflexum gelatinilyticum]